MNVAFHKISYYFACVNSNRLNAVCIPRRDSRISAFRMGLVVSGRGLCDISRVLCRVLFRVTKSRVKKLGSRCMTEVYR